MQVETHESETAAIEAIGELYHSWLTGLILTILNRKNAVVAEDFVFRLFRRQHEEKFLPGLEKLGLSYEPHAVAAAKYHYFSNQLGGVSVEYLEASPTKAWIRYPPPRWIWMGTAICAIPSAVNRAMLRGWHAQNGVTLSNPRLGFVCTKTTVDGQPGLEGYYLEHDHDLEPNERLLFRPEEEAPYIDPCFLPQLDVDTWPPARRSRAARNYSMEYIRNALPVLLELVGPEEMRYLGRFSGLQIGMSCHRETARAIGIDDDSVAAAAKLLTTLMRAQGDDVVCDGTDVVQRNCRLWRGMTPHPAVVEVCGALWEGLLLAHNRFIRLEGLRLDDGSRVWRLSNRR